MAHGHWAVCSEGSPQMNSLEETFRNKERRAYDCAQLGQKEEMEALIDELTSLLQYTEDGRKNIVRLCSNCVARAVDGKQDDTFSCAWKKLEEQQGVSVSVSAVVLPLSVSQSSKPSDMFFKVLKCIPQEHLKSSLVVQTTFYEIARFGSVVQAQAILKHVRVKQSQSDYLREACLYQNYPLIDFLLPLSNVESALKYLYARKNKNKMQLEPLERFVEAKRLKKQIGKEVASALGAKPHKGKLKI